MKVQRLVTIISLLLISIIYGQAQHKVAVISFYMDKEVDFSLMNAFIDNSKDRIQKLVDDPEFDLSPVLASFNDYFITDVAPLLPFTLVQQDLVFKSEVYQGLSNQNRLEKTERHQPAKGYLPLGKSLDDTYLAMISDQSVDGLMTVHLQFFIRKNMLKTVVQAQVVATLYNSDGKRAWNYTEFGISKDGVNTIAGWSISKKKEVMPLFEDAVIKLQEKMSKNIANRSKNATKKL